MMDAVGGILAVIFALPPKKKASSRGKSRAT